MALSHKSHGRSQVYLQAFDPEQHYNVDEHELTVDVQRDAPPSTRPTQENLWQRIERERHEKKFESKVQDRFLAPPIPHDPSSTCHRRAAARPPASKMTQIAPSKIPAAFT